MHLLSAGLIKRLSKRIFYVFYIIRVIELVFLNSAVIPSKKKTSFLNGLGSERYRRRRRITRVFRKKLSQRVPPPSLKFGRCFRDQAVLAHFRTILYDF